MEKEIIAYYCDVCGDYCGNEEIGLEDGTRHICNKDYCWKCLEPDGEEE